jgi:hypothetical protein
MHGRRRPPCTSAPGQSERRQPPTTKSPGLLGGDAAARVVLHQSRTRTSSMVTVQSTGHEAAMLHVPCGAAKSDTRRAGAAVIWICHLRNP